MKNMKTLVRMAAAQLLIICMSFAMCFAQKQKLDSLDQAKLQDAQAAQQLRDVAAQETKAKEAEKISFIQKMKDFFTPKLTAEQQAKKDEKKQAAAVEKAEITDLKAKAKAGDPDAKKELARRQDESIRIAMEKAGFEKVGLIGPAKTKPVSTVAAEKKTVAKKVEPSVQILKKLSPEEEKELKQRESDDRIKSLLLTPEAQDRLKKEAYPADEKVIKALDNKELSDLFKSYWASQAKPELVKQAMADKKEFDTKLKAYKEDNGLDDKQNAAIFNALKARSRLEDTAAVQKRIDEREGKKEELPPKMPEKLSGAEQPVKTPRPLPSIQEAKIKEATKNAEAAKINEEKENKAVEKAKEDYRQAAEVVAKTPSADKFNAMLEMERVLEQAEDRAKAAKKASDKASDSLKALKDESDEAKSLKPEEMKLFTVEKPDPNLQISKLLDVEPLQEEKIKVIEAQRPAVIEKIEQIKAKRAAEKMKADELARLEKPTKVYTPEETQQRLLAQDVEKARKAFDDAAKANSVSGMKKAEEARAAAEKKLDAFEQKNIDALKLSLQKHQAAIRNNEAANPADRVEASRIAEWKKTVEELNTSLKAAQARVASEKEKRAEEKQKREPESVFTSEKSSQAKDLGSLFSVQ